MKYLKFQAYFALHIFIKMEKSTLFYFPLYKSSVFVICYVAAIWYGLWPNLMSADETKINPRAFSRRGVLDSPICLL